MKKSNSSIFYKLHYSQDSLILALCDSELIGKKFSDSKIILDLDTFKNFYLGEELVLSKAKELFEQCDSINLVGKNSVEIAKALGYINENDIRYIQNVPHVQIYKIFNKG
ncbi:MAG: DUF424 family protein [Candidatus Anstonellaceae archaeon]